MVFPAPWAILAAEVVLSVAAELLLNNWGATNGPRKSMTTVTG